MYFWSMQLVSVSMQPSIMGEGLTSFYEDRSAFHFFLFIFLNKSF